MPRTDAVDQHIGGYRQRAPLSVIDINWLKYTAIVPKSNYQILIYN